MAKKHSREVPLPPWTPLLPARPTRLSPAEKLARAEALARDTHRTVEDALHGLEEALAIPLYMNSRYTVAVRHVLDTLGRMVVHLSIKRNDKQPVGPERYRDFMRIKDELLGPDRELVELYPSRSREADSANQYHLWGYHPADDALPPHRFPFGFDDRLVTEHASPASNAVQSPFEPHHPREYSPR